MSMTATDFLNNYGGERHPAFKFENVGDTIKGTIAETPRVVDTKNMNNGQDEKKLVITVTAEDGETYAVWVKAGFAANAVKEALREANAEKDGLQEGGQFAMRLDELRNTGKPQPAKVFKAKYTPPAPKGVGVDDLF